MLPLLHAHAKDFHFPSAGKEDLGRLGRANVNIPGQHLQSVKCWHRFVALGITWVTGGTSVAGGPEDKHGLQRPPKPGCRGDPSLLHYTWFSPWLLQPGGAARTGVLQRSCCWNTAASQIPSATISQVDLDTTMSPSHPLQPHPGNISQTGISSESNSQVGFSTDSFHPKPGSSLQLQQFQLNPIPRPRWMPQL